MSQEINVFLDRNRAEAQKRIHGGSAHVQEYAGIKVFDHRADPDRPVLKINEGNTVFVVYKESCK